MSSTIETRIFQQTFEEMPGSDRPRAPLAWGRPPEELSLEACEVTPAGCEVLSRALAGKRLSRPGARGASRGQHR